MNEHDFDDLFKQARMISQTVAGVYRDVTGEDLDVDSAIRHYPLFAVALAAGAGALGGYWFGRRAQPKQLPPPKQAGPISIERLIELNQHRKEASEKGEPLSPLDYVEHLLQQQGMELEDAAQTAKDWASKQLEPRLREGMEAVLENMAEFRVGTFLRQAIRRADTGEDQQLEDPENGGDGNSTNP